MWRECCELRERFSAFSRHSPHSRNSRWKPLLELLRRIAKSGILRLSWLDFSLDLAIQASSFLQLQ